MSRTTERRSDEIPVRVQFLEKDVDDLERDFEMLDSRLSRMLWTLVGILVSTTTAAILLALNLVVAS